MRTERAMDDPVREMEGMLDEYGRFELVTTNYLLFFHTSGTVHLLFI